MDYVKIKQIVESEFDAIINEIGGKRIVEPGSADYILNECVLELKLVEEEGLEKTTRRERVAEIFRAQQPDLPVVVIDPQSLDSVGSRAYYNAVAGPIKTHVKKAATQLEATRARIDPNLVRVLIILNNGYTALSHEEFKSICLKCVQNDTRKIDWVIVGGMYYHSDKFDHYLIAHFEGVAIDIRCAFPSLEFLKNRWGDYVQGVRGLLPKS